MRRRYLGGFARSKCGFLCTWENERGETLTLAGSGPVAVALPRMIREALACDETFRLASWSTPDTILTDVLGRTARGPLLPHFLPEYKALRAVGRLDLLHPRLAGKPS